MQLLFRASEHNFKIDKFHEKCDNIKDTFVLIRTNFGKTIGAYTHYEWKTEGGFVNDSQRRAFLLQMDVMEKMVPLSDNYLIYRGED